MKPTANATRKDNSTPEGNSVRKGRTVFLLGPEHVEMRHHEVPDPIGNEILLQIDAALTCGTDLKVYRRGGHPRMLQAPCPFGHEMAGTIVAIGSEHELWSPGDRVVVANSCPCHKCEMCLRGRQNLCPDLEYLNGAYADFLLVPARFAIAACHRIPEGLAAPVAALAEPLACVLHCVHSLERLFDELKRPADVVVYGGGTMGLLLTMVLEKIGHRVVCCDPNPTRLEIARAAGAAETLLVDRRGEQAERVRAYACSNAGFDVAIDASGSEAAWLDAVASVAPGGEVVLYGGCAPGSKITLDTQALHYSELTVRGCYHHRPPTFAEAINLLASDQLPVSLLLSEPQTLDSTESALRKMMDREALKVVITPAL
jgi:L-iditol 2-dehydrogenase